MSRTPTETRPSRIAPLAKLPVFFGLSGRRVILAGGSEAAAWKAELLAAAGAKVEVYAERMRQQGRYVKVTQANLTYVAIDNDGKPCPIQAPASS